MEQKRIHRDIAAQDGATGQIAYGRGDPPDRGDWRSLVRSVQRACGSVVGLGLVGAVLAEGRCLAQVPNLRLTVRPHEMATGTRTERAGVHKLDSLPKLWYWVYVPQQCVGTRRCPLIVFSNARVEDFVHVADTYGMLVAMVGGSEDTSRVAVAALDRGMKAVLQRFAVDPDKIVIAGRCATGQQTVTYGAQNLDVFSRIVVFTQHIGDPPVRAPHQRNEYYIAAGLLENVANFKGVQRLRERGYPVKHTLQFRGHTHTYEDHDFMGHWLQESWAIPDPKARPAPRVFGDPPLLTAETLAKMTAFWSSFQKEPDSIRTTARQAVVREVIVSVGSERVSTLMADMPALAARYRSVAAALKAAGLTPPQHDVYRAALTSARIAWTVTHNIIPDSRDPLGMGLASRIDRIDLPSYIEPTSAVAKNLAFMEAHPDEVNALSATNMWRTP